MVHSASGLSLARIWPVGRVKNSCGCRLARDLDCCAAQARDPGGIGPESAEERLDFAQAAATVGGGLIEDAELRLLFGDGLLGLDVDEVQVPFGGDAIAIGEGFREVVTGFEKDDGDLRLKLEHHMEHDDVFGLKARGDAGALRVLEVLAEKASRRLGVRASDAEAVVIVVFSSGDCGEALDFGEDLAGFGVEQFRERVQWDGVEAVDARECDWARRSFDSRITNAPRRAKVEELAVATNAGAKHNGSAGEKRLLDSAARSERDSQR